MELGCAFQVTPRRASVKSGGWSPTNDAGPATERVPSTHCGHPKKKNQDLRPMSIPMAEAGAVRKPIVVRPEQGRVYAMGRMRAIFKADRDETAGRYSISEWWLEPRTRGPEVHAHPEDHVFYVIAGT